MWSSKWLCSTEWDRLAHVCLRLWLWSMQSLTRIAVSYGWYAISIKMKITIEGQYRSKSINFHKEQHKGWKSVCSSHCSDACILAYGTAVHHDWNGIIMISHMPGHSSCTKSLISLWDQSFSVAQTCDKVANDCTQSLACTLSSLRWMWVFCSQFNDSECKVFINWCMLFRQPANIQFILSNNEPNHLFLLRSLFQLKMIGKCMLIIDWLILDCLERACTLGWKEHELYRSSDMSNAWICQNEFHSSSLRCQKNKAPIYSCVKVFSYFHIHSFYWYVSI